MAKFPEAMNRMFLNMYICMKCNARNRGSTNKKPTLCRKCGSTSLRLKKKGKVTKA
ncbi:MAG: 50S ribosomal protein L40e [Candidatus Diapherotrites archaeon]|nr:50S ribosomal protein L40e [Candidatus Diapherotrites archaeon]